MVSDRQRQWCGPELCGDCARIGRAISRHSARPRPLDDLVNKFGERVRAVSLDVADESAAQAAVQVALDAFMRLGVVVNNAGSAILRRSDARRANRAIRRSAPVPSSALPESHTARACPKSDLLSVSALPTLPAI